MKSFYLMLSMFSLFLSGCREKTILVTGRFTDTGEDGINIYNFNDADGTLSLLSKADAGPNPSYFCFSGKRNLIYTINEVPKFNGTEGGGLTTLRHNRNFRNIEKVKEITIPNGGPCFISITPDNDFLLIANYTGGSVAVVRLDKTGIPEKVTDTIVYKGTGDKVSHAHMIFSDPQGSRVYVTDLGLDRIMIYTLDKSSGKLMPFSEDGIALPAGTGPRHFVFNASRSKMYVIGELNSTVNCFDVDDKRGLILSQSLSTLREGFFGPNSSAEIHTGRSGEYLYGSNRGENSIVTFRILKDGQIRLAGHTDCGGNWPRNFVIDPSGKYIIVGNQRSGNLTILRIDKKTGVPSQVIQNVNLDAPACLKFKY